MWGCSRNLKPTSAASGNWKGLPPPRPVAYRGRKPSIDPAEIHRLRTEEHLGASAIARRLGIGRASVYRALASRDREP